MSATESGKVNAGPSTPLKGASLRMPRRERPEDGGIAWHEKLHAFECLGCGEFHEVHSAARRTPDRLAELREFLVVDHTECWEFADPQMARDARRFRKRKKLERNLAGQRVAWRGGL